MSAKTLLLKVIQGGSLWERNIEWCHEYSEPGYSAPEHGILFANWNPKKFDKKRESQTFESRLANLIDKTRLEIECEWSDEWTTCDDCNGAVRTSPNSYSWLPSYVTFNDCDIVCHNCVKNDIDSYEEHLINDANHAAVIDIDWSARGWTKFNGTYENGWHEGQNDNPREICKSVAEGDDFLFEIVGKGQFDTRFIMWVRSSA